jgi:anaerobic dimethyl sulfoxide reductase subunit A
MRLLTLTKLGAFRMDRNRNERIVRVGCPAHNCGGRCLLAVHVKDGLITRISTDDRPTDTVADSSIL